LIDALCRLIGFAINPRDPQKSLHQSIGALPDLLADLRP